MSTSKVAIHFDPLQAVPSDGTYITTETIDSVKKILFVLSKLAIATTQSIPRFIQEFTDTYVQEGETVELECKYSGNPTPDIVWFKNDKMMRNTDNIKIKIDDREFKTSLVIKEATHEDSATYICKATSDIGLATTKAQLQVTDATGERPTLIEDEKEKVSEKVPKKKKPELKKEAIHVQDTQLLETVELVEEEATKLSRGQMVVPTHEAITVEVTSSMKKTDHEPQDLTRDQAQVTSETLESVSEIYTETDLRETRKKKKKPEKIKVTQKELLSKVDVRLIIEGQQESIAQEVEEIMELFHASEFGPAEQPLRELATIGYLVRQGVTVHEINESLYKTDKFPALKTPDAQNALVQLVERQGHGPLITQVLTEETTTDESIVAATVGFRAFMKMVELQHATVEEVITHFKPEDFRPRAWEVAEAIEYYFLN
ncbi:titin-like [Copidosoma floridanum]|uniref:titin-like n=1 Tax=Copidosoma floridanum TaxID=29053 RepID=UPI000C6F84A5|nr:titin-like [Copidosoma floridanum]